MIIFLQKGDEIKVGGLGYIEFREGYYIYIGSALNSLESRIERHLSKDKRLYWHIDYLLEKADVIGVVVLNTDKRVECEIGERLATEFGCIKDFGSSDCRCRSHLFYSEEDPTEKVKGIISGYGDVLKIGVSPSNI